MNLNCSSILLQSHIFVILLFISSSVSTHAQVQLWMKGGANFDKYATPGNHTGYSTTSGTLGGFHFSMLGKLFLNNKWSSSAEIQFSRKGTSGIYGIVPMRYRINFDYIEFPLLLAYQVSNRFVLEGGPTLSFLTRSFRGKQFYKEGNAHHFGINAGLQIKLIDQLFLISRYYVGLTPFEEITYNSGPDPSRYPGGKINYYHRTFQVSLAYHLSGTSKQNHP
jgi:hypothetical protein